jgi:hypothetical protein
MNVDSFQTLDVEMNSLLEPLEGAQPSHHLDFSLTRSVLASELQNYKIKNLRCVKPLSVEFLIAAVGNQYSPSFSLRYLVLICLLFVSIRWNARSMKEVWLVVFVAECPPQSSTWHSKHNCWVTMLLCASCFSIVSSHLILSTIPKSGRGKWTGK